MGFSPVLCHNLLCSRPPHVNIYDKLRNSIDEFINEQDITSSSQSVDQILQVEDDKIITTPTTPRVGSSSHTPRPPDSPTPRSRDRVTPRSANTAENVSAPLGNSTPRPPDKKKDWGRHDDKNRQRKGVKAPVAKGKGRVMVSTLRGTRVIARNDKDGLYYPGG